MTRQRRLGALAFAVCSTVAVADPLDPMQMQLDDQARQIQDLQQRQIQNESRPSAEDHTLELIDKLRRAKKEDQIDDLTQALATRVIDAQIGVDQLKKQTAQLTDELHSMPPPEEPMRPWQVAAIALGVCVAYSASVTIGKRLLRR